MKRYDPAEKFNFPDLVNSSLTKDFTQVPNTLLRNPDISAKAKTVLCILLSNRDGWKNHITGLQAVMKEGLTTIQHSLKELETHGYLLRVGVRNSKTKVMVGSFWACSDIPGGFDLEESIASLTYKGLEPYHRKPYMEKPYYGFSIYGKAMPNNINNKNINNKNTKNVSSAEISPNGSITKGMFEKFYLLYPRKASKGKAISAWDKICNKPTKDRPTWKMIRLAIRNQKKSDQWQNNKFIPLPSTWLNQSRWLDEPDQMIVPYADSKPKPQNTVGSRQFGSTSKRKDRKPDMTDDDD